MQPKCQLHDFPCIDVDYSPFDRICNQELKTKVDANSIVNKSEFCTLIPIDDDLKLDHLETSDYLKILRGKIGVYHLWIDVDECDDHKMNTMLGVYVGKGFAEHRINNHLNDKVEKADFLYVSFYECENRLAKYIEQLFLDTYKFHLNKAENRGKEHLYAVWDKDRYMHGTELHNIADIYARRIDLDT